MEQEVHVVSTGQPASSQVRGPQGFSGQTRSGHTRARSLAHLVALFLVVQFSYLLPSTSAQANWFGATGVARSTGYDIFRCGGGNMTDNKAVHFAYDPVDMTDEVRDAVNWTRQNLLEAPGTTLTTTVVQNPGPSIDVYVIARPYTTWCEEYLGDPWTSNGTTGVLGLTNCETLEPVSFRCDKAGVRVSTLYYDAQGTTAGRWLACHEVGHAIGLTHRDNSGCMRHCQIPNNSAYTPHDIAHFASNWSLEDADAENPPC